MGVAGAHAPCARPPPLDPPLPIYFCLRLAQVWTGLVLLLHLLQKFDKFERSWTCIYLIVNCYFMINHCVSYSICIVSISLSLTHFQIRFLHVIISFTAKRPQKRHILNLCRRTIPFLNTMTLSIVFSNDASWSITKGSGLKTT